jgi:hypothetical protein
MKPEKKAADQAAGNRRKFLLGATLGSAGAVAAIVAGGGAPKVLEVATVAPQKKKVMGYHETDHIRQYYETTRI